MSATPTRRGLLAAPALLLAPRIGLPAGAAALALVPRPAAAAVDPVSAVVLVQAGLSLYRMARGGGPGLAALLRQQSEMLRALRDQIAAVQEALNVVYADLKRIEGLIGALPRATAVEHYRLTYAGQQRGVAALLATFAEYRRDRGIAYATHMLLDQATDLRDGIRLSRDVLMSDGSLANLPAICSAWYNELEVMAGVLPFDPVPIRVAARSYLDHLDAVEPLIEAKLRAIEAEAEATAATVAAYARLDGYRCFTDARQRSERQEFGGGGGPSGEPEVRRVEMRITASRKLHTLLSAPAPLASAGSAEADAFADLREAGLRIPPGVDGLALRQWSRETADEHRDTGWITVRAARRQQASYDAWVREARCTDREGLPAAIVERENGLTAAARTRAAEALAHYALKLCCRDARESLERTLGALQRA